MFAIKEISTPNRKQSRTAGYVVGTKSEKYAKIWFYPELVAVGKIRLLEQGINIKAVNWLGEVNVSF